LRITDYESRRTVQKNFTFVFVTLNPQFTSTFK